MTEQHSCSHNAPCVILDTGSWKGATFQGIRGHDATLNYSNAHVTIWPVFGIPANSAFHAVFGLNPTIVYESGQYSEPWHCITCDTKNVSRKMCGATSHIETLVYCLALTLSCRGNRSAVRSPFRHRSEMGSKCRRMVSDCRETGPHLPLPKFFPTCPSTF